MPRTVSSRVHIGLPAQKAWQLRNHFPLETHIAALNKRALTLIEEDAIDEGTENEQRHRVVRCELVGDQHIGKNMMGVKAADLCSDVASSFYVHKFDEEHGTEFFVDMAMKRLNIAITGHQWCVPETETSCFLCTCVDVEVKLPGIGGLVEMQLERRMRASHAAFPKHAVEYLKSSAASLEAPSVPAPAPPPSPDASGVAAATSEKPSLNWGRLAWAFVASGALRQFVWPRKLPEESDTMPVRLNRRHARLLLVCGCASTVVDSDEIVE